MVPKIFPSDSANVHKMKPAASRRVPPGITPGGALFFALQFSLPLVEYGKDMPVGKRDLKKL